MNPPQIKTLLRAGMAASTRRAYANDLRYFWAWAGFNPDYPVPVGLLRRFAVEHSQGLPDSAERWLVHEGLKRPGVHAVSTIRRRLQAVAHAHREMGLESPTRDDQLRGILSGATRLAVQAGHTRKKSKPITKPILDLMIGAIDGRTVRGLRARAVLEFAFYTGGRRRGEVATARIEYLEPMGRGFYYHLDRSKTDQTGKGRRILLRSKRAGGMRRWLRVLRRNGIESGYIFRGIDRAGRIRDGHMDPGEVNRIVKMYLDRAGIDPTGYSAHGLRRGFVSWCGRKGIPLQDVMQLTGHKQYKQVLEYYEQGNIERNPATMI